MMIQLMSHSPSSLILPVAGANLRPVSLLVHGVPRLFYRTLRRIEAGEELLVDYGHEMVHAEAVRIINEQVQNDFLRRMMRYALGLEKEDPRQVVLVQGSPILSHIPHPPPPPSLSFTEPDFLRPHQARRKR